MLPACSPMGIRKIVGMGILLFVPLAGWAGKALEADCARLGGERMQSWRCPSSGMIRVAPEGRFFCRIQSRAGVPVVFDGCSVPRDSWPEYAEIFYLPCKAHDLCYHHLGPHTARTKAHCDTQFYYAMIAECKKQGPDAYWKECGKSAALFYQAVETLGFEGFYCSNVPLDEAEIQEILNR